MWTENAIIAPPARRWVMHDCHCGQEVLCWIRLTSNISLSPFSPFLSPHWHGNGPKTPRPLGLRVESSWAVNAALNPSMRPGSPHVPIRVFASFCLCLPISFLRKTPKPPLFFLAVFPIKFHQKTNLYLLSPLLPFQHWKKKIIIWL